MAPIYSAVAMRIFQRDRMEYAASSEGFMTEHAAVIKVFCERSDLQIVGDADNDPQKVKDALDRIYAKDTGGLMK
eukprot:5730399-Karenia_brevis.AAC.1